MALTTACSLLLMLSIVTVLHCIVGGSIRYCGKIKCVVGYSVTCCGYNVDIVELVLFLVWCLTPVAVFITAVTLVVIDSER